jgi:hypothetical protein
MTYESSFKALEGHKILALYGDNDTLQFTTEFETLSYSCEGDCCSSSWFEHISGVEFLVGHTIVKTEDISLDSVTPEEEKQHESLAQYGYRFTTDKGYFEIDMRNSSNGYYGGYITGPNKIEEANCSKIENDW